MTIHILRHGETEFNRLGIVQGSGVDTSLNDIGQEQASAFFDHYGDLDFQLVVTSHLQRTHQTVARFIEKGMPWVKTPDLNEISWGEHEGLVSTPERVALYDEMIGEWKRGNFDAALPGGETARQLGERLTRFVKWLQTRPADRILICTHGRTMRALVSLMKGIPLSAMEGVRHANTGCYIARLEEGNFIFELENSTKHLENLIVGS